MYLLLFKKIENISFLEAVCKVAEWIHYPLHLDTSKFQPKVDENQPLFVVYNRTFVF